MTIEEWRAEGERRFGPDQTKWRFKCPSCGYIATAENWKRAGAPETAVAFSCVGRWIPTSKGQLWDKNGGPCNYAGGGLFRLNPLTVIDAEGREHSIFEFGAPTVDASAPKDEEQAPSQ
jgi:hypothetical protein